jgi:hypothetical protein
MTTRQTNRRRFIRSVGAAGVVALAGCTGDNDGGGKETATNGQTQQQELTEINIVYPPWPGLIAFNYITEQTNILENSLNERGYTTGKISRSWDDTTLFLSGKADFMPTAGAAESARMAMARDIDLTVHAQAATNYMGWYVREGSDLDTVNTGSFESTMQKVVEEDRPYGHAGWNQGIIWPNSAILQDKLGMSYGSDTNPPLNIKAADYATLPKLLVQEDLDIVVCGPPVGTSNYLVKDDPGIKCIQWQQTGLKEAGISPRVLNLGAFTTRSDWSDENEEAMIGWMEAWKKAVNWVSNPDNWNKILRKENNWQYLAAESRKEAEINLQFSVANSPAKLEKAHTDNPMPVILGDISLNEERIANYKNAIKLMEKTGALTGSGWEDRLSFKPLSI